MDFFNMNATLYIITIILLIVSLIIRFFNKKFAYWKERGLDYLEPVIPFGNAFSLVMKKLTIGELFAKQYLELRKKGLKHGGAYFYWIPVYIPVDPDIIKRILISDFEYFPNHGFYMNKKVDPFSAHIFNMKSGKWKNFRAKLPVAFTSAKMRKMFLVMEEFTKQLTQNLDVYAVSGTPLDIKKELSRFTTDVITSCAFGFESNTMKMENEELLKQGRSFFDDQWNIYKNSLIITIPHHILLKLNFRVIPKEFEKYFLSLFQTIMSYRKESQIKRGDIMDILLRLTENSGDKRDFSGKKSMEPMSFKEFACQAAVIFEAGFETTSSTLTFALYELAKHLECQNKLRIEINETLAKYDRNVTYDAVMEMKYLEKIIDGEQKL